MYRADNHGWFIATSGGKVFQAGPSAQMHWITTTGAGTITSAGARGSAGDEMNGNAVLYDVGKILTVGGAPDYQNSNATAVANVVDISTGTAQVTPTSSMTFPRGFANSVALPDRPGLHRRRRDGPGAVRPTRTRSCPLRCGTRRPDSGA